MIRLEIPARLPCLNDYIDAERVHRQRGAKMKKDYTELVAMLARAQLRGYRAEGPVILRYRWYEPNRKRDKDNIAGFGHKVIQDGLVLAGVLRNDGWAGVDGFTDEFEVDKNNPRVVVELEEVNS